MDRKQEVRDLMFRTEMARKRRIHPVWTDMGLIAGQPRVDVYKRQSLPEVPVLRRRHGPRP